MSAAVKQRRLRTCRICRETTHIANRCPEGKRLFEEEQARIAAEAARVAAEAARVAAELAAEKERVRNTFAAKPTQEQLLILFDMMNAFKESIEKIETTHRTDVEAIDDKIRSISWRMGILYEE